jgi:hypothetical protein
MTANDTVHAALVGLDLGVMVTIPSRTAESQAQASSTSLGKCRKPLAQPETIERSRSSVNSSVPGPQGHRAQSAGPTRPACAPCGPRQPGVDDGRKPIKL